MDDLISRQALRSEMYHEAFEKDSDEQKWDSGCWIRYKMFERVVDRQPSAQTETQKATWALHTYMPYHYYCTHCRNDSPYNKTWSYCPNCGYEMEGYV